MRALEEQLAGARRDIGEIRKSARAEAQAEEAKILAAARDAANEKVDAAVARISDEKQTAATTLRGTAKVLSADIAAQVMAQDADTVTAPHEGQVPRGDLWHERQDRGLDAGLHGRLVLRRVRNAARPAAHDDACEIVEVEIRGQGLMIQ